MPNNLSWPVVAVIIIGIVCFTILGVAFILSAPDSAW